MREERIALSICVLSYNGRDVLARCLEALERWPANGRTELVVTDNGSSDGTSEMLRAEYPRARLFRHERNRRFTAAFNEMIREARGELVLLLSNDVEVQEGTLDRLVRHLRAHPEMGAAVPLSRKPDGELELICKRQPTFPKLLLEWTFVGSLPLLQRAAAALDQYPLDAEQVVEVAQDSCIMLKREVLGAIGGFDERLSLYYTEDDLCKRIRAAGWTIGYLPSASVRHLHRYTTRRMKPWHVRWLYVRDMLTYTRKHHGMAASELVLRPLAYLTLGGHLLRWARRGRRRAAAGTS
jgi:N-acetylglucosaminyl-diphospho-decaprenol L-rhamnosyltransferase